MNCPTGTNRLREIREQRGLERYDISAELRVGDDSIRLWEDNKRLIPTKHIAPLARFLDVTPEYLMGWDREPATGKAAA
jgi:transcriptional regulator with XRE-family HTH domain